MAREELERRLREIQDDMLILASMVEKAIQKAMDALTSRDLAVSREVVDEDRAINAKRYEIEEKVIHTMATQQPPPIYGRWSPADHQVNWSASRPRGGDRQDKPDAGATRSAPLGDGDMAGVAWICFAAAHGFRQRTLRRLGSCATLTIRWTPCILAPALISSSI
jgi:hypothetical protein